MRMTGLFKVNTLADKMKKIISSLSFYIFEFNVSVPVELF